MTKEEIAELYKWFSDNAETDSGKSDAILVLAYVLSNKRAVNL